MANTTIAIKKSGTPAAVPGALANGELAINYADGKLYYKNSTGQIVSISGSGGNSFGIANVDNILILSSTGNDVLNFKSGNGVSLSACSTSRTITFNGKTNVQISNTAPGSPAQGDIWWNSNLGRLFIYYADGDSNQWVEATPSGGSINTANLILYDPTPAFNQANGAYINANNAANSSNAYVVTVGAASNSYTTVAFATANIANAQANNISADKDMKGFLDQLETYLRFDTTSNTFTLADSGAGWSYWLNGNRYTKTGNSTVVISSSPVANGNYYITIQNNGTGTLTASNTAWDLSDPTTIPVAYIKYNQNTTPKYFIAEERHTVLMDSRTHRYLHYTRGTQAQQFGLISGYTVNGTSNANNIFSISTTILNDEDIILTIPADSAAAGVSNNYLVFYRYAANSWSWVPTEVPYIYTAGGFINYDSSAVMTQAANNVYVNSYLIFTNLDQGAGFAIIPGRASYANLSSAQSEDAVSFDMTGFGVLESVVAYQFNWKTDSTLTTAGKCQLADAPRKIGTAIASVAPVYTSGLHNDLGGLQGGNGTEYYHMTAAEYTASQNKLTNSSVTLAGALNTTGSVTSNGYVYITPSGPGEGGEVQLQGDGANTAWSMDAYQNNYRIFARTGSTLSNVQMFHSQGGGFIRLGVNKTDPQYTLDVNGIANAAALILGAGGTAAGSGQLKLAPGSKLATPEAGVIEYDLTDNVVYFTANTTEGRKIVPSTEYYRLTANTAAIGPAIADFFGSNSSIPLSTNGVYEIEIEIWFIKTTAGTVTYTLTNSTTVTNLIASVQVTPAAGFSATPTANTTALGGIVNQTAAASAFAATASLTNASPQWAKFKIILENGASTSLRLRVTSSAGTVTPLRGSYWKATRISSTNTGTYPA